MPRVRHSQLFAIRRVRPGRNTWCAFETGCAAPKDLKEGAAYSSRFKCVSLAHTQTNTRTHTHTQRETHKYTSTLTHKHTHTPIHRHTHSHTLERLSVHLAAHQMREPHTHKQTTTHTNTHTHTHTHTHTTPLAAAMVIETRDASRVNPAPPPPHNITSSGVPALPARELPRNSPQQPQIPYPR